MITEMQAVYERHSVRSYKSREIESEKIQKLEEFIDNINAEGSLNFKFVKNAGKTFNRLLNRAMGLSSAPSVIACIGRDEPSLNERVGYYGEKLVLYAQMIGLNTCWAGTFNANAVPVSIGEGERLVIVIAIGYGAVQGKPHRSKKPEQVSVSMISRPAWFDKGVELALLAPTAINQQKFEIILNEDATVSFKDKGGILSDIDLGIIKYHFELAQI